MQFQKVFNKKLGKEVWKIDITIAGQRIRRAEFPSKKEAEEAVAALRTHVRAMRFGLTVERPKISIGDIHHKLQMTHDAGNPRLKKLELFFETVDEKTPLIDLKRSDFKNFVIKLEESRLKDSTINRYLSAISGALRDAGDYFPELEDWQPPRLPWKAEPEGRNRVLSADEVLRLTTALRSDRQYLERFKLFDVRREIYDLFRLMILTGAREGELLNLPQSAVSWEWQTARIDATKTKTTRIIPLSPLALEILRSRSNGRPGVFRRISNNAFYTALKRASEIAGVEYGDRIEGGWVLYDLRHLAATTMENAGIPYSAVSAILGHKRTDQTATYTHAQIDTMRRGVEILEQWAGKIDGFTSHFGGISRTKQRERRACA